MNGRLKKIETIAKNQTREANSLNEQNLSKTKGHRDHGGIISNYQLNETSFGVYPTDLNSPHCLMHLQ